MSPAASCPPPALPAPITVDSSAAKPSSPAVKDRSRRRLLLLVTSLIGVYLVIAYVVMPFGWRRHARRHPPLDKVPRITYTGNRIPGDPLNVMLIGTEQELKKTMLSARWYPADPLTLRSCLGIAAASVLRRSYDSAPVSNLYLQGRKQDLAFQQAVDNNPRKRHHVRFWRLEKVDDEGRPIWVGSAVYDRRVGLSKTTGQITHVTAPDVDTERDYLFRDLEQTGDLTERYVVDDFHQKKQGRNGGGDRWYTDGQLHVGVLAEID